MSFISYAQNFEDVMLWRALKHIERGFYVDIGANDPVVDSVSKAFYDRGWRGVHVEPVAEFAQLLREARPDEEIIEKAVGAQTGELTLHVFPSSGLSSLVDESARAAIALLGYDNVDVRVPVITLDELLAPYAQCDTHWLKIDVEGAERDVLRGWNAKRDRPWIMVVEATVPSSPEECYEEWEPILLEADYQFVYFDGLSRFYVAKGHGDLAESFRKPPNVFDDFHRADLVAALAERDENARQCGEVRSRLEESTAQLDAAQRQLAAAETVSLERHHLLEKAAADMERLVAENAQVKAELDHARSELRDLESALGQVNAELGQKRSELRDLESTLTGLRAELDSMLRSTSWRLTAPLRGLKHVVSRR